MKCFKASDDNLVLPSLTPYLFASIQVKNLTNLNQVPALIYNITKYLVMTSDLVDLNR
jgi:hypothetical protein